MYYLLPIFLFSTIFAIPYEEGEYVSEEHQNITKETLLSHLNDGKNLNTLNNDILLL